MSVPCNPKFCPSFRPLAPDFAEQLLSLEMHVELSYSLSSLKRLLELYTVKLYLASGGIL